MNDTARYNEPKEAAKISVDGYKAKKFGTKLGFHYPYSVFFSIIELVKDLIIIILLIFAKPPHTCF